MFLSRKSALLVGIAPVIFAANAIAQQTALDDEVSIQDVVVVTAQNREQDVQDVPIAMRVVAAEDIARAGFGDASNLGAIDSSVQVNLEQGTVKITIRGIGTNSNNEAQDTSVVANIDGEYINRPQPLSIALFDLERVEVLRGPQGTLYGRNSTAGAINFITRKPSFDFGANASIDYGNYDHVQVDAGIDVPITDTSGLRVAGFYRDRDGFVKHPAGYGFGPFPAFDGGRSDDNSSFGGRLAYRLDDPGNRYRLDLALEYASREYTPPTFAFADLNAPGNGPTGPGCNASGFERIAPAYAETLCIPSNTNLLDAINREEYLSPAYGVGRLEQDTWALRGRYSYEFSPEAILTYTGGYRSFTGNDDNFLTLPVLFQNFNLLYELETQSHELRLNGEFDNGIIYQGGVFYFKEDQDVTNLFTVLGDIGVSYVTRFVESDSISAFGQIEVPLSDTLTAIGGLRYTDNERTGLFQNASALGMGPPDPLLFMAPPRIHDFSSLIYGTEFELESQDDNVTWLAGLTYEPNANTMFFGKVSTGFKGGGFDALGVYAPENNTAYEAGSRHVFGDGNQYIVNVNGFYYDYTDLQVPVLLDTSVGAQVFNAGAATIWGLELDAQMELFERGLLSFSANYLNAEYDELLAQFNAVCVGCALTGIGDLDPNTPGVQQPNFAGNKTPFSPEWIIRAGYEHEFDLGASGLMTAGVSTTYKDSYFSDLYNYSDGQQQSFTSTDVFLKWQPENQAFTAMLYARNLEDERPLTYGSFIAAGPDDIFNWQFGQPRTYGLRVAIEY